jgi:hypothetical protein
VPREQIEARLKNEGLSDEETRELLESLMASPLYEASSGMIKDARRWQMLCRLHDYRRQHAPAPTEVLRRTDVSAEDLHQLVRPASCPVLIPGLLTGKPILDRWTPASLADRFGDVEVNMTIARDQTADYAQSFRRPSVPITVRALVERMAREPDGGFYLVAQNHAMKGPLGAMLDDLELPDGYLDAPKAERCSLWMGPANTLTTLHHDRTDILFLQVHGDKQWRLIAPTERALLDRVQGVATLLDPEDLANVVVKDVTVHAGDALLVPLGWWHQVRALSASVSLSVSLDPDAVLEFFRPGSA